MKIICINRIDGQEVYFHLRPDTALLRNNDPLYYPDFTQQLVVQTCHIFRVCRLGRSIAPRFAGRYVDAVGAGLLFTAADLLEDSCRQGLPHDPATGFDYSAAVPPIFIPFDDEMAARYDGVLSTVIPAVSRFLTLKIGDYIFIPTDTPAVVCRGAQLDLELGESKVTTRLC